MGLLKLPAVQFVIALTNGLSLHVSKLSLWHHFTFFTLFFPHLRGRTSRRTVCSLMHFDASLVSLVRTLNLVLHTALHRDKTLVLALLALVFPPLALLHLVRRVARESACEVVQLLLVALQLLRDLSLLDLKFLFRKHR